MKRVPAYLTVLALLAVTLPASAQKKGNVITIGEVTIVGRVQKPIASVDVSRDPGQALARRAEEAVSLPDRRGRPARSVLNTLDSRPTPRGLSRGSTPASPVILAAVILFSLACAVASARRLFFVIEATPIDPGALATLLRRAPSTGPAAPLVELGAALADTPRADWERNSRRRLARAR